MQASRNDRKRRGAVAPFTAVLAMVLVGMVAFAVDLAWVVVTQNHLQSSVDAAALAGDRLMGNPNDPYPRMNGYVHDHLATNDTTKRAALAETLLTPATWPRNMPGITTPGTSPASRCGTRTSSSASPTKHGADTPWARQ